MEHTHDGRAQHRHGDLPEALPAAGAVEDGRFLHVGGHRLQRRQIHHHIPAQAAPQRDEHDAEQGHGVVRQPADRGIDKAEQHQHIIERALFVEHEAPHDADHGHGGHHRHVKGGAEQADAGQPVIHQHRQRQRADLHERHHQQEHQRIFQAGDEHLVLEDIAEIIEPDPVRIADQAVVGKGQQRAISHWPERKHGQQNQRGREEQPGIQSLAPHHIAPAVIAEPAGRPYPSTLGSGTIVDTNSTVDKPTTDEVVSTLVPDPRVDTGWALAGNCLMSLRFQMATASDSARWMSARPVTPASTAFTSERRNSL
jgi:hypothetical protein